MSFLDRVISRLACRRPAPPATTDELHQVSAEAQAQLQAARQRRAAVELAAREWERERRQNHFAERIAAAYRGENP